MGKNENGFLEFEKEDKFKILPLPPSIPLYPETLKKWEDYYLRTLRVNDYMVIDWDSFNEAFEKSAIHKIEKSLAKMRKEL